MSTYPEINTPAMLPTVLELSGITLRLDDFSFPSLVPLLDHRAAMTAEPIVSSAQMLFDRREAVRFDGFKYIVSRVDGREELYDLRADPAEHHSIADSAPDRVEMGRRLLETHQADAAALKKRLRIDDDAFIVDEDMRRRLRSLGYLQ